jgi:glycosyltransferase 2 family protein
VNPSIKKKINISLFFILAVFLLYIAFKGVDFDSLLLGFKSANYYWVALSVFIGFLAHIVRVLRWQLLIEPIGFKPSFFNVLGALITGYMANLIFPRLGEVTRCGTLTKTDKVPFESLLGTVIVERAFDVLMMLVLVVIVFFIRIDFFGTFIWDQAVMPIYDKGSTLLLESPIYIVGLILFVIVVAVLLKRNIFGHKFSGKVLSLFWGLIDGLKSVFTMKKRKTFLGYTLLIWFLYWLMTWVLLFATQPTSSLGAVDGFFILVIGSFGMAAPVQGGIGAFHVITAMALSIYGISWDDGLVFATISHGSQTLFVILLGLMFSVLFFLRSRSKTEQQNA